MRNIIVTEYLTLAGVFDEPGQWSFAQDTDGQKCPLLSVTSTWHLP
jgi:hypothetical protein